MEYQKESPTCFSWEAVRNSTFDKHNTKGNNFCPGSGIRRFLLDTKNQTQKGHLLYFLFLFSDKSCTLTSSGSFLSQKSRWRTKHKVHSRLNIFWFLHGRSHCCSSEKKKKTTTKTKQKQKNKQTKKEKKQWKSTFVCFISPLHEHITCARESEWTIAQFVCNSRQGAIVAITKRLFVCKFGDFISIRCQYRIPSCSPLQRNRTAARVGNRRWKRFKNASTSCKTNSEPKSAKTSLAITWVQRPLFAWCKIANSQLSW